MSSLPYGAASGADADLISVQMGCIPQRRRRNLRILVPGGTAGAVIDLSNEHPGGGYDVEAPTGTRLVVIDGPRRFLIHQEDVSGPLVIVHGQPGLDVALVDGQPAPPAPPRGGHLVNSCPGCKASAHLEDGDQELSGCTVLAIVHEPGCLRLGGMLSRAGESW